MLEDQDEIGINDNDPAAHQEGPLAVALAAVAQLDLNPLCEGREHAVRLLREDVERIVLNFAKAMEGKRG